MKWDNLKKVLEEYASYFEKGVKDKLPTDYEIRNNINVDLIVGNNYYTVEFKAPEYFKWIENGRGPGKMPPINVIEDWILKKHITPYATKNGKLPTTNQLAFLIARKIGEEGTSIYKAGGLKTYERTFNENKTSWDEKISDAISEDILAELTSFLDPIFSVTIS